MSISELTPGASPAEVVADATEALRSVAEILWSARSDEELVAVVEQVQQLVAAAAGVEAGALAEADARDLARGRLHYGSTGDWVTHLAGLRRGEGRRRVVRATALTGPLSHTREALVAGTVSPEQAEVVVSAVDALPPRDWTRRRGEKVLVDQAARLDATDLAKVGRHLAEVVDPDAVDRRLEAALEREERAAHLDRFLAISQDRAGGVRIRGRGSAEDGALLRAALLPLTRPAPADTSRVDEETGEACELVRDPREAGARCWDALVTLAQHALDTDRVPDSHAVPARLLVTVDHQTLRQGLDAKGVGVTADGTDLPPGVLRRLACEAEIIPAVLDTDSAVLDVGRLRRLVTPALWAALVLRDRHCTFPGCHRPPVMCHTHHLTHWTNGGKARLDNLALLCGHHHRVIHHTPWEIRLNAKDRRPEFRPPPKPGIVQEWIRYRPRQE